MERTSVKEERVSCAYSDARNERGWLDAERTESGVCSGEQTTRSKVEPKKEVEAMQKVGLRMGLAGRMESILGYETKGECDGLARLVGAPM